MKRSTASFVTACLSVALSSNALAQAQKPRQPERVPKAPVSAWLTDDLIKQAVKDTLAERKTKDGQDRGRVLSGEDRYDNFARQFDDAKVPGCLRPDGLKHQPTFIFSGLLAAPFVAIAALRGKCN